MKVEVSENGLFILKEVFNSIILETEEGNRFVICIRDDTVEMTVSGSDRWFRADMTTGDIEEI